MSISTASAVYATLTRYRYVAAGGETSLSGVDANGNVLSYGLGLEQVYLNGVLQVRGQDYTATTGTSITGLTALVASDVAEILVFSPFTIANAVDQTLIDAKGDILVGTADNTIARLAVGSNNQFIVADSTQATGVKWTSTLTSPTLSAATLTSTLTANASTGTSGQLLQSTGTGVQWATISTAPWTNSAIAANTNLVTRYQYFVTTSSAWTLTLPASPNQGDEIRIFDVSGSANTNNITVSPNGLNLQGSVQNFVINVAYGSATLVYTGSTYGWKVA